MFKKENSEDKESISEDFTRHSQLNNEKEVEIVLDIVSETIRPPESESDEVVIEKESKENDDQWIYCELCVYKCKTKKTMTKHNTTKHESESSTSTLEEHKKTEYEARRSQSSGKTQKCKVGKSYEEQLAELDIWDYPRVK